MNAKAGGQPREPILKRNQAQWNELREFILERDNFTCQVCGIFLMDISLEVHHIKPLFKGGTNDEANLITLCHECHRVKHLRVEKNI